MKVKFFFIKSDDKNLQLNQQTGVTDQRKMYELHIHTRARPSRKSWPLNPCSVVAASSLVLHNCNKQQLSRVSTVQSVLDKHKNSLPQKMQAWYHHSAEGPNVYSYCTEPVYGNYRYIMGS